MIETGHTLGRYHILEQLGAGGMGVVFRAHDERLQRDVALKVLPTGSIADDTARKTFRREALALSKLNHPHIAAVYDFDTRDDVDYLVMEYVPGETLAARLARGPLSESEVADLGTQIAGALQEAHEQGVIHRDLKPGNIALTSKGTVKVLDFGLAKILGPASPMAETCDDITSDHAVKGTLPYMAPEQLMGTAVDAESDIYSFGAVLYEMATGRRAFPMTQGPRLVEAILHEAPPLPRSLNGSLSPDLEGIVLKALEKEPVKRYHSARALADDLTRLSTASHLPASPGRGFRFSGRGPTAAVAAAAALLLLILGLYYFSGGTAQFSGSGPPSGAGGTGAAEWQRPILAVLPLMNVSGDPSIDHVGTGIMHSLTTSLSGVPSVSMISPSATAEYAGKSRRPSEIARNLGATFVVTGSVQRAGERLNVTVNIVRADDSIAWGGESEGSLSDLFALQRGLAGDLSRAMKLMLTDADRRRLETPPTQNNEAFGDYTQARTFLARRDVPDNLDRAITLFESAIGKDQGFALAYAGLGEACWRKYERTRNEEWTVKAREATERALQIDPEQAGVRFSLAVIYNGTGRSEEAVAELRRVLELQPRSDDAHRQIGEILTDRGRTAEAIEEFRKAIENRPNYWENHYQLGLALYRGGRFEEAERTFLRVTELQPDHAWGFQMLGVIYHVTGDLDRAVGNYERAIRMAPSPVSYSNLGTIYYQQGKFEDAVQMYSKSLQLRPKSGVTHRNLGDAYRRLGREKEAQAAYVQALELTRDLLRVNPNDARAMGLLSVLEGKLGRRAEARRHAARAVVVAPEDNEVLYRKAVVHALAGESAEAMAALREALARGYNAEQAREDDDLRVLRGTPDFEALTKK